MIARSLRSILIGAASAGLLASAAATTSATAAEPKAAILLPGSINDQSWNALGFSILQSLKPHGFATAYSENVSDADEAEALRGYANQGYGIVMGHSGRFVSAMEQVAPDSDAADRSSDRNWAPFPSPSNRCRAARPPAKAVCRAVRSTPAEFARKSKHA
jgi:basic membrane lipoprotein Med (substrate-binding protein (PBP1-ABC) superfamily)